MRKLKTAGINTIRGFLSPALNFVIAVIGIKLFGKTDWGITIDILLWIYLVLIIASWGNKEWLLRSYSRAPSKVQELFANNLISRSPLLLLSLVFPFIFDFYTGLLCILLSIILFLTASFESLIIHYQKFSLQLVTDLVAFVITAGILFLLPQFNILHVLILYTIVNLIKLLILAKALDIFHFKTEFSWSFEPLKYSFPFFLMAFAGWLGSKIDMYLVTLYLPKSDVSEYQLLSNSFLMLVAGYAFIITPFTKHIYRISLDSLNRIKQKLSFMTLPYLLLGSLCIWLVMELILKLNLDINYYYLSAIKTLFPLLFYMDIMMLNKQNQEKKVTLIIFIGLFINSLLILLWIKGYGITGVLAGGCISGIISLLIYKTLNRKLTYSYIN
ncbi:lipopolysaccharide biosynthesis protein [Mangrovimonas sp. TPBH4]|uniref:lipopolysaccharide biosynthesis protein n=1 Tax=Mangrovimonas sp. TPBH4 TaxID=1645914 RepID=UPI0006B4DE80|nr:oligosaccharide flippase family protein [Mangrovimonas sp. TPBH4]